MNTRKSKDLTPPASTALTTKGVMLRVWEAYLRAQKTLLGTALICAIGVALSTQFLIWWLKPAIEILFHETASKSASHVPDFITAHPIIMVPLVMIAITVLRLLAQLGLATSINRCGHQLVGRIQSELFSKLVHADLGHLQKAHSGQYLSSVLFDAGLMREAATNGVVNYVQHTLIVVAMLINMAIIDWRMTLGVLVAGPFIGMALGHYNRRTKKAALGAMDETSTLSTAIMEGLDGVKIIKINNQETFEEGRVNAVITRRQNHIIKGANARASAAPVSEALTSLVLALVIAYAGWRAGSGAMTLGGFTAFISALGAAGQSLRQVANLQTVMAEGFTAARRLFGALDIEPEINNIETAPILHRDFKTISVKDVSFGYGDTPVLAHISFEAPVGKSLALVGPSGSGKSSLLNLLPRFYDQGSGVIEFDGKDHRSFSLKSLRDQIALVTQDPFLFDDTIAANIGYGRPQATQDDLMRAAKDAAAHEFIMALPQGYDTRVGEAGSRLSGGQKQRIAIARAFLKDAPLLLLDEATSALDTQSETLIQAALERLMKGRTTIVIAHRLSTIRHVDQILVLKCGEIVERGRHEHLVSQGGLYAELAAKQFENAPEVEAQNL